MGYTSYSAENRSIRASSLGYFSKSTDETFTQQKLREVHEEMASQGIKLREARDSDIHPASFPVVFFLDVTGSMGIIPDHMVKDGLPTMMSTIIQRGTPDIALLFGGIGDHEVDKYPLQVGQFESGDAELDMWLTRTYIEKGGGGNLGESYPLAWYFAANHIGTDAWDKRKQKGVIVTCGDEPFLPNYPASSIKSIMGNTAVAQGSYTAKQLYYMASEKFHVYHIHLDHGRAVDRGWQDLLGQNLIVAKDPATVSALVADLVLKHSSPTSQSFVTDTTDRQDTPPTEIGESDDVIFVK
jgi:hypothetical protein